MAHKNYRCPDCSGVFRHVYFRSDEECPDRCPLCNSWMNLDSEPPDTVFVAEAPYVRTSSESAKAVDDVYHGLEDGSKLRAQMMAEAAGGSASEYSHTHITNIRTGQGAVAAMPPQQSDITRMMAQTPGITGHQHNAMAFAEANRHGIGAYAGERTRQAIASQHRGQLSSITNAGNLGSHK